MIRKVTIDNFTYELENNAEIIGLLTETSEEITISIKPFIKLSFSSKGVVSPS